MGMEIKAPIPMTFYFMIMLFLMKELGILNHTKKKNK
jgi:hypothetical protein